LRNPTLIYLIFCLLLSIFSWIKKTFARGDFGAGTFASGSEGVNLSNHTSKSKGTRFSHRIHWSSILTSNPPQSHDPYRSIVANNVITQLTLNMKAGYNDRTSLPCERISRTP